MGDYYRGGAADDELAELRSLHDEVNSHPDDFDAWEKLVRAAEGLEGGLHRNSSPQSISAARDVYDRFLAKFPLFFGYWKKYADLEFAIAGTESAEYIYERAVASVPVSVDLWTNYCNFKVDTCHDHDLIRALFDRGADSVGLDFLAHPFWDKFIEFEERSEQPARVFAILARIITIPLHQYARYFERYRMLANSRPIDELAEPEILKRLTDQTQQEAQRGQINFEQTIRGKVDQHYLTVFNKTQTETNKRWTYEQEIKRPYFHVTDLDESQLLNWSKYLDFEEGEGNLQRIVFLYERCLVALAHHDEFWLRYARYMYAQKDKEQETRNAFERASCLYAPIARPAVRYQYALFEESQSRPDVAAAIYEAVVIALPDDPEPVIRLANLSLRQHGVEGALQIYSNYIESSETSPATKGTLIAQLAKLIQQTSSDSKSEAAAAAREAFERYHDLCAGSETYWAGLLAFEVDSPITSEQTGRAKKIFESIRSSSRLSPEQIKSLTESYMSFLTTRGGAEASKEWMDLDAVVHGSGAVAASLRIKNAAAVDEKTNGGR